jgi:predicted CoA-substrate-specific enzyme activase
MVSPHAVGIEIGLLYVKAVGLDDAAGIVWRFKARHQGDVLTHVSRCLEEAGRSAVPLVGVAANTALALPGRRVDPAICLARGATASTPSARHIIEVGGSTLTLVDVDDRGQILALHRNSLCAAGTGSFLDEQAARLGLDPAHLNGHPFPDPPSVAARCAVFAKSDLIHRQQEGFSREVVWSGLCRGLAEGVLRTLTCGRPLTGVTVLCGGVALNKSFVWWFERALANGASNGNRPTLMVMPDPEYAVALGAALQVREREHRTVLAVTAARPDGPSRPARLRPTLLLRRSVYPERGLTRAGDARGNEVGLDLDALGRATRHRVFLGTDIGSTSTKCALVDEGGRVVLDLYRPTAGDPIGATRALFSGILDVAREQGVTFDVLGVSTTGSGRKLVGRIVGADLVVNEITAHGRAAVHLDPAVETIFEIGGQDAKYMAVEDGQIVDANMNYVCAAGTGSFVEEVASKLGYRVDEVGDAVLGLTPPFTSSRCTVFMEQDVLTLVRGGASRQEALGAVLYSVVENYIARVVGRRRVSESRVMFQGATARNRGLVAAIENLLNVEVVVPPYCHVMGAYGAALLAREAVRGRRTTFRGLDLGQRSVTLETDDCTLCNNRCRLTRAVIEGESDRPAWGMVCGRDEHDTKMRVPAHYALYRTRTAAAATIPAEYRVPGAARRVVLPRTLSTYSFSWFWAALFKELGVDTVTGPPTGERSLDHGKRIAGADLCLPMKVAYGHVAELLSNDGADAVFVPHMIADQPRPGVTGSKFCPYVEVFPSLVRAALKGRGADLNRLISPVIDFTMPDSVNARNLAAALRPLLRVSRRQAERAFATARATRIVHEARLREMARDTIAAATRGDRPAFVVIGRPYNALDPALSLEIPYFVAASGFDVVPMDCLDTEAEPLDGDCSNMYWAYGQRVVAALKQVARTDGLYAIYLTSFGCGPDSFLLSIAESVMGRKPFLVLELDEHGSSGGYETRIEAFLDVVRTDRAPGNGHATAALVVPREPDTVRTWTSRTVWIPPMHPVGSRLFAAALRRAGVNAQPLPLEDDAVHALGKRCTRGGECLPAPLTLGSALTRLQEERRLGRDPEHCSAFFMPTCSGPCRFGQYRTLQRLAFDREGYAGVPIISPSGNNTYDDVLPGLHRVMWEALLAGDILFKMRCKALPYEATPGDASEALERWTRRAEEAVAGGRVDWTDVLGRAMADFKRIAVRRGFRPLVGIVGEIYVRANAYANNHVVDEIERLGGEVWLAPISEWIEYCVWLERFFARLRGDGLRTKAYLALKWRYLHGGARRMYKPVLPLLHDRLEPNVDRVVEAGRRLLPPEFEGEAILSLGRSQLFEDDGARLVVDCAPFSCMQGNIATALIDRLRDEVSIPIVNMFYDGTGSHNRELVTFLAQAHDAGPSPGRTR